MPIFVGLTNPDYKDRLKDQIFEDNCRDEEITTEGILKGVDRVAPMFDAGYRDMIKKSALFVCNKK